MKKPSSGKMLHTLVIHTHLLYDSQRETIPSSCNKITTARAIDNQLLIIIFCARQNLDILQCISYNWDYVIVFLPCFSLSSFVSFSEKSLRYFSSLSNRSTAEVEKYKTKLDQPESTEN